jgi:hypothetical protein
MLQEKIYKTNRTTVYASPHILYPAVAHSTSGHRQPQEHARRNHSSTHPIAWVSATRVALTTCRSIVTLRSLSDAGKNISCGTRPVHNADHIESVCVGKGLYRIKTPPHACSCRDNYERQSWRSTKIPTRWSPVVEEYEVEMHLPVDMHACKPISIGTSKKQRQEHMTKYICDRGHGTDYLA